MITFDRKPCNVNADECAVRLMELLADTAGKCILSGQHTQTNPMEERAYIKEKTGHFPKVVGFEMLSYSRNINYDDATEECLTEVYENRDTIDTALKLAAEQDIIVTICFHWFSPVGGRDKAFYSKHTDFDPESIFVAGSVEEQKFYEDLDVIADELEKFHKAGIPVLWRPFHEAEGTWFWWGRKGAKVNAKLYIKMYDYFCNVKKLNNLLWVWSSPVDGAYPGDEYVDVVGWDIYLPEKKPTDYADYYSKLTDYTAPHKVHALTEIGYLPDVKMLEQSHTPWAYFMTWSKEFIIGEQYNTVDELNAVYHSDYVVTL